jgi:hypothetical protein
VTILKWVMALFAIGKAGLTVEEFPRMLKGSLPRTSALIDVVTQPR